MNQVIQGIELESSGSEFGNVLSSVTVLGTAGEPVIFTYNKDTATIESSWYSKSGENTEDN